MTQFTLSLPLLALIAIFANAAFKPGVSAAMAEAPSVQMRAEMKRKSREHKVIGLPLRFRDVTYLPLSR